MNIKKFINMYLRRRTEIAENIKLLSVKHYAIHEDGDFMMYEDKDVLFLLKIFIRHEIIITTKMIITK